MEHVELFFTVSGVIGWAYLAWRIKHGIAGVWRRLKWAIWPSRGRAFSHKSSRPRTRDAASGSWGGHSASRWPAVHVDKTTGEIWEA